LDFLNSVAAPKGEPIERLGGGAEVLEWLDQAGLLSKEEALGHFTAQDFEATATKSRQLRGEIREAVLERMNGGPNTPDPVRFGLLNKIFATENRFSELVAKGGHFETRRHFYWQHPDQALLPLADAVADLFCYADFSLIHKCENPKCPMMFLDRTKGHRRRWCSAAACGNRAKVAAHRARQRNIAS
jgi:predicted RNA-binding Zn ribbon-like protein